MIPAVIRDLQERIPPLDVPPSEGFASGRAPANPHIDFDHRRPRTTSPVLPEVENRHSLEDTNVCATARWGGGSGRDPFNE